MLWLTFGLLSLHSPLSLSIAANSCQLSLWRCQRFHPVKIDFLCQQWKSAALFTGELLEFTLIQTYLVLWGERLLVKSKMSVKNSYEIQCFKVDQELFFAIPLLMVKSIFSHFWTWLNNEIRWSHKKHLHFYSVTSYLKKSMHCI